MATKLKKGEYPYYIDFRRLRLRGACAAGACAAMRRLLELSGVRVETDPNKFIKQRVYLSKALVSKAEWFDLFWLFYRARRMGLLTKQEENKFTSYRVSVKKRRDLAVRFVSTLAARRKKLKKLPPNDIRRTNEQLAADVRWYAQNHQWL